MIPVYIVKFNLLSGEEAKIEKVTNKSPVAFSYSKLYEKDIYHKIMSILSQVYYYASKILFKHPDLGFIAIGNLPQEELSKLVNTYRSRVNSLLECIDKKIEIAIDEESKEMYRNIKEKILKKINDNTIIIYEFIPSENTLHQLISDIREFYKQTIEKYAQKKRGREKLMANVMAEKIKLLDSLKYINTQK